MYLAGMYTHPFVFSLFYLPHLYSLGSCFLLDIFQERTEEILRDGGGRNHVMNLGHGIDAQTPEENAAFFVDTVKNFRF